MGQFILLGIVLAVTLWLAELLTKQQFFERIKIYSEIAFGVDGIIFLIALVWAFVSEISVDAKLLWAVFFFILVGIQQEIIRGMKEKFVAYVGEHADDAYFTVECVLSDRMAVGLVSFGDEESFYCAAVCVDDKVKTLLPETRYSVSLSICYDVFGQPEVLSCRIN